MASPARTSSTPEPASYSQMGPGESDLDAIGARCQYTYCHQLDFLPFKCNSCKSKFCLDHRTEDGHSCPNKGAWARFKRAQASATPSAPKPTILTHDKQCAHPACKTLIDTALTPGIHCSTCRRDYCLRHRLNEDHDCARLARAYKKDEQSSIGDALGKLRAWGAQKRAASSANRSSTAPAPIATATAPLSRTPTTASTTPASESTTKLHRIISPFTSRKPPSSSSTSSRTAATTTHLLQLKRTAKGDPKLPQTQRIHVHLEAVSSGEGHSGAKVPRADAYYNKDWSVGKVLDAAARTLQVVNVNNRGGGEEERLRVFSVEGGRLLAFGERVGEGVRDGDTLVLLRGVGAGDGV